MESQSNTNNSCTKYFNCTESTYILIPMGAVGILSVIVCSVAVIMVVVLKLYKYAVHRLAMYQVMAALFHSLICVFELVSFTKDCDNINTTGTALCEAAGFLLEYGLWVKLMFTLCLTFHLFCFSVLHKNFQRFDIAHILISVFGPFLFVWIPFINDTYGQAGAWCWIKNWQNNNPDNNSVEAGEIYRYVLLYGPAIISLLMANIAVIVIIIVLVHRAYGCCNNYRLNNSINESAPLITSENLRNKKVLKEVLPLVVYPILSFLLYIPAFINRLVGSITNCVNFYSFILSAISLPALGMFAGLTLIIHIIVLQCSNHAVNFTAGSNTKGCETNYTIPQESDLEQKTFN